MRFAAFLPLLVAAAPGTALAQDAAPAAEPVAVRGPVSCIGGRIPSYVDRDALAAFARKNFVAESDAEEALHQSISSAIMECRRSYGWGDPRQEAALTYFRGSTIRGNAAYRLRDYNVESEQFDLAYRAVPEAEITRLVETGAMSGSAMTAAARAMEGAGATFGTPDGEALQTIGAAIGQGIYGTLLMEQAVQDYRAR